ncbi:MAG: VWA domain-containing protein, partial [Woeseiaceae bacterium]|nr:VWA domain-containing protein [Woeseiaceae bacterium]
MNRGVNANRLTLILALLGGLLCAAAARGEVTVSVPKPPAVILLVDKSSSMTDADRDRACFDAVQTVVRMLVVDRPVFGVVQFATNAEEFIEAAPLDDSACDRLKAHLAAPPAGATLVVPAIDRALERFSNLPDHRHVL